MASKSATDGYIYIQAKLICNAAQLVRLVKEEEDDEAVRD